MTKRLILVVAALGILFGGIFGWKFYQNYQMTAMRAKVGVPLVTVSSAVVTRRNWQPMITSVGGLTAVQGVLISSEVPGKILRVSFESGRTVETDDLLVELDSTVEKAHLRALEAELEINRNEYERAVDLAKTSAVSQAQLDKAKGELERLLADVDEQIALIAKKSIHAPFSGELGIRKVSIGEYVSPGTEIVSLQSLNPIFAEFMLPERYLNAVALDQAVDIEIAAYPDKKFRGRITAISPRVEVDTRNLELQATFENPGHKLRPGMFAKVFVYIDGETDVLAVAETAVDFSPGGNSVFVIIDKDGDLVVERRQVKTGRLRDGQVEIISGMDEGETVVQTGQIKLRSGQKVRIDNSVELPQIVMGR